MFLRLCLKRCKHKNSIVYKDDYLNAPMCFCVFV